MCSLIPMAGTQKRGVELGNKVRDCATSEVVTYIYTHTHTRTHTHTYTHTQTESCSHTLYTHALFELTMNGQDPMFRS